MVGGTTSRPSQPIRTGAAKSSLIRTIALALLALIVLVALIILITWLVLRPKKLQVSIDEASIHDYCLQDSKFNSTFDFTIRVYNPNRRFSVYYDKLQATVSYSGQLLATQMLDPFFQGHKNVTRIMPQVVARNIGLEDGHEQALKGERTGGAVSLDVRVNGKIRFKIGKWKTRHHKLRVKCAPLVVCTDPKKFKPMKCKVHM